MANENNEQKEKLLQLATYMLEQDKALREQFQIGDKFRFIRDRLQALAKQVEEGVAALQKQEVKKVSELAENEVLIYVYLYNAQGLVFKTWEKMLTPSVFYEYSVNRPIYLEKNQIEEFIRSRTNKIQHAFLTIAINKDHILKTEAKDVIGNPLIKVKEGSLSFKRLISFSHNGHDYVVDANGSLIRK